MIIYEIKNKTNNKIYVGKYSKCNTNEEFQQTKYWGSGIYIKRAIEKYGIENFERRVLVENISNNIESNKEEKIWIMKLNSKLPNGYNLTDGGDGLLNPDENVRKIMSEKKKGKRLSPQTEYKKGKEHKYYGKKRPEISARMSGEKNPMYGIHIVGADNINSKKALLISPEKREYILPSVDKSFCREHNLTYKCVCRMLTGERNHHKGWTGKYL